MAKTKRSWGEIDDSHYKRKGKIGDPCTYCGLESCGYDHIPPLSYFCNLTIEEISKEKCIMVPCCRECNTALTNKVFRRIVDRRRIVKEFLRKKYRKYINMPHWDEDELADMDKSFADEIRRISKFASYIRKRIMYY